MSKNLDTAEKPIRLAILISGNGSNMQAIVEHCQKRKQDNPAFRIEPVVVISDRAEAAGLAKAKKLNVENFYIDGGDYKTKLVGAAEKNFIDCLRRLKIDLVILAGFMRVVKSEFLQAFSGRTINIHPSLLPFFQGLDTHQRAIDSGATHVGASLHLVNEVVDGGTTVMQKSMAIGNRNAAAIKEKIHTIEHQLFRQWLDLLDRGFFSIPLKKF